MENQTSKGHSPRKQFRATQQKITADMAIATSRAVINQPSKMQLRASIPTDAETQGKRIETKPKRKTSEL